MLDLETVYQESRYPDVSKKIPVEEYDENEATDLLNVAMEVMKWIREQIKLKI